MSGMRIWSCAVLLLLVASSAWADRVLLTNGDRLSGRLVAKFDATLLFETVYAGRLKIAWPDVQALQTEDAVVLQLNDGELLRGVLDETKPGRLAARGEGGSVRRFTLSEIAYLNPRPDQAGTGIRTKGRVDAAASATQGNGDSRRLFGQGELLGLAKHFRFGLSLKAEQREEGGREVASNWLAAAKYDRFLTDKRFVYARASFENDDFKDLQMRSTLGGGYGLQLIDREGEMLSVRAGLDYVDSDFRNADDEAYPALGWGVNFSRQIFRPGVELFHDQEGFVDLRETERVTLRTRTGLRVPLMDALDASAQLNLDWEGEPADGARATDTTLLLGLGYHW